MPGWCDSSTCYWGTCLWNEYIFKLPVGFVSSNFNHLIYQSRVNGRMSCLTQQRRFVTNFMGATQIQIIPQTHVSYNCSTILKGNEQAFKLHKLHNEFPSGIVTTQQYNWVFCSGDRPALSQSWCCPNYESTRSATRRHDDWYSESLNPIQMY